jgi:hypothetical protein
MVLSRMGLEGDEGACEMMCMVSGDRGLVLSGARQRRDVFAVERRGVWVRDIEIL